MELHTKCLNCGKVVVYAPENVGAVWLCPACGARVQLPEEIVLTAIAPPPVPSVPVTPPPLAAPIGIIGAPLNPEEFQENTETSGTGRLWVWIAVGAVVFIAAMVMFGIELGKRPPDWERLHRQDIYDLKADAERLAKEGRTRQAYSRFHELSELVSGNQINDPELKAAVVAAEHEENDAMNLMLGQVSQPTVAIAATEPAAIRDLSAQSASTQPAVAATQPTTAPALAQRPRVHRMTPSGIDVDERIGRAIQNGVDYLLSQFDGDRIHNNQNYTSDGVDALAVYALLQAYQATGDSRLDPRRHFMAAALDALKRMSMIENQSTYSRSLRISALTLAGRNVDHDAIDTDLHWLLQSARKGAFTYPTQINERVGDRADLIWDNSNTQYGLLGVWAAADAGLPVPRSFWEQSRQHWVDYQFSNGQWGYAPEDKSPTRSMTLAGLASLFVTQDYLLDDATVDTVARQPFIPALRGGLAWLEQGDNSNVPFHDGWVSGYTLYGLERVGLASGFKFFGSHDWYRDELDDLFEAQIPDGSWNGDVDTSFALLFLARGRHPVVLNKLRFNGYWDNHPRDAANLTRYASKTLERQLNWQVVPMDRDWTDWTDGPIVYLASHEAPTLDAGDLEKLRLFVLNGGLLLTQADGASHDFTRWATDIGEKMFAPYKWAPLPADHPLWSAGLKTSKPLKISAISNGSRLLMVHLSDDYARDWEARASVDHPDEFDFGLDLFLYASGRTSLRNRVATLAIPDTPGAPAGTMTMTQLRLSQQDDPEPAAWPRFARWFRQQTNLGVNLLTNRLDNMTPDFSPVAHLTGVSSFNPTDAEITALTQYVDAGGVVLIDPCGGPNSFLVSVRENLLPRAFPGIDLTRLESSDPLLTSSGDGMSQLWPLSMRDYVRGLNPPIDRGLWMLRSGKGAVVVSSLDITSGLLGTNTWGIAGWTPDYSLALAKNFILWAWDGAK